MSNTLVQLCSHQPQDSVTDLINKQQQLLRIRLVSSMRLHADLAMQQQHLQQHTACPGVTLAGGHLVGWCPGPNCLHGIFGAWNIW